MKKAKFWSIAGLLLTAVLLVSGCGGGDDGLVLGTDTPVTGITLKAGESTSGTSTIYLGSTDAHLPASVTFTVTVEPADATNKSVQWAFEVEDAEEDVEYVTWDLATLTATAKALGGPTKVTVKTIDGNFTAEWTITVADPGSYVAVTAVSITNTGPLSFTKTDEGFEPETIQLDHTVSPGNATAKAVSWSVDPEGVVTVDRDGLVTPIAAGGATITLKSDDNSEKTATIIVTVTDPDAVVVPVESVAITTPSPLTFTKTGLTFTPANFQLVWTVSPDDATNKAVTWAVTSTPATVATVNAGLVTPIGVGSATITVTSAADPTKKATITVTVMEGSQPPEPPAYSLIVVNQNETTDTATTTTLPELNSDNRYVIVNNEANANIASARANVTGNTIVYLDKPLKIGAEEDVYTPYSISARVRLTGVRTVAGVPVTGGNYGVITGIFTDPTVPVTAQTPLKFVGARSAAGGQKRMYITRDGTNNDNSSASFASSNAWVDQEDNAAAKTQGFKEQEYIFKVERTTNSTYTLKMFSADGLTELASNTRGSGNALADVLQSANEELYLGFIISSVTAEISDIVVMDGTEELFKSPVAIPYPQPILKVNVSTTDPSVGADAIYDYQCIQASFPTGGVQLKGQVIPIDAASLGITWSIGSGTNGSVDANGLVTITDAGAFTVKAQSDGEPFGEFKFNIFAEAPPATAVTVTGLSSVESGESITLTASVVPPFAVQTVTWSVTADDDTTATTAATINETTGVLTAGSVLVATEVHVFATTTNDLKSLAHKVTVMPSGSGPVGPVLYQKTIGGIPTNGEHSAAYNSETGFLTVTGDGVVNGGNTNLYFVYTAIPKTQSFVATVKMNSFAAAASDNSKAGLWTFYDNPAGNITSDSAPFYLHVGLNNTAGEVAEMRRLVAGNAGRTAFATSKLPPLYVRITYTYTTVPSTTATYMVSYSTDGTNFTDNGTNTRTYDTPGDTIYLGLGVCSNNVSTHGVATFSEFTINGVAVDLSQTINIP
jgi:uncharacterized protein YjdB